MSGTPIVPKNSAPPLAPYSPAMKVGNVVHVSGVLALDENGSVVSVGDCGAQTRHVLEAIKAIMEEAGGGLRDIAFTQIFLRNLDDYAAMNTVYREYFPENPPARYCVRADLVKPEFLVEIAATAYLSA